MASPESKPGNPAPQEGLVLATKQGTTHIQPHVVAKIAGLAVREVRGVHALVPFGTGQQLSSFAKTLGGGDLRELGVQVEVGQVEAAVDCRLIAEYGASIPQIAAEVRASVSERIAAMTGLRVTEVNIEVVDLWFDEAAAGPTGEARVQ